MQVFKILSLLLTVLISESLGKTKTKCEIVKALRAEGVQENEMRDWLCLVENESSYRYDIEHVNSDNTTDYGIFQLNSRFMCGNKDGTNSTTCWKLRSYGCADACNSFLDSYISNDVSCAVRVKNCDGFGLWYGWIKNCNALTIRNYSYSC